MSVAGLKDDQPLLAHVQLDRDLHKRNRNIAIVVGLLAVGLFILLGDLAIKDSLRYGNLQEQAIDRVTDQMNEVATAGYTKLAFSLLSLVGAVASMIIANKQHSKMKECEGKMEGHKANHQAVEGASETHKKRMWGLRAGAAVMLITAIVLLAIALDQYIKVKEQWKQWDNYFWNPNHYQDTQQGQAIIDKIDTLKDLEIKTLFSGGLSLTVGLGLLWLAIREQGKWKESLAASVPKQDILDAT